MFFNRKLNAKLEEAIDEIVRLEKLNYSLITDNKLLKNELNAEKAKVKATVYKPVKGITAEELDNYRALLKAEYDSARSRQKSKDAKPSDFMRGLGIAIDVLSTFEAHDLI